MDNWQKNNINNNIKIKADVTTGPSLLFFLYIPFNHTATFSAAV